jgi:hypothetical protein
MLRYIPRMRLLVLGVAATLLAGCPALPRAYGHGSSSSDVSSPGGGPEAETAAEAELPRVRENDRAPDYVLDDHARVAPIGKGHPVCSHDDFVTYRGVAFRYEVPATIHAAFAARLTRFEEVVRDVAIEVYGRAPKLLHHAGGFSCRITKRGRLSEHALGNALDVAGFTFAPLTKAETARLRELGTELPAAQRRGFRIDVGPSWAPAGPAHAKRFYAMLLQRVRARDDVFRGMIGPPDPEHRTHLHLDAGPWAFSRYELPEPRETETPQP